MFLIVPGEAGESLINLDQVDAVFVREGDASSLLLRSGRTVECTKKGAEMVAEAIRRGVVLKDGTVLASVQLKVPPGWGDTPPRPLRPAPEPQKAPPPEGRSSGSYVIKGANPILPPAEKAPDPPVHEVMNGWGKVWRHELGSWGFSPATPEPSGHAVKESQSLPPVEDVKLALGHTPTEEGTKIGFFGQTLPAEGHRAYDPKAITAESWNRLVKETEKALGARDLAAINRRAAENLAAVVREKWKERAEVAKRTAEVWTGSWHEEGSNPSMVRPGPEKSKDEKVTEAIGARINDNWGKEWKDHSILRAQAEKTLEPFAGTSRICACETCDSLKTCQTYLATNGDATSKVALCKDCAEAWGTKGPGG